MTKIYEQFIRDDVSKIKDFPDSFKGELTVIISEKNKEKKIEKKLSESV